MLKIAASQPSDAERCRLLPLNAVRRRALERLYERRAVIDDLIGALEQYQQTRPAGPGRLIEITVGVKS